VSRRARREDVDCLRELCGGSVLQMPADDSVIVRNYSFMTAPWDEFHTLADGLLKR
jgi:hypothetical protein